MSLPVDVTAALDRLPLYNYNSGNPTYNFGGEGGYGYVTLLPAALTDLGLVASWLATALMTASAEDYRSGAEGKILLAETAWLAGEPVDLGPVSGALPIDLSTCINVTVELIGDAMMSECTNGKMGQTGVIEVTQDDVGGHELTVDPAYWQLPAGEMPAIGDLPNSRSILSYYVQSNGKLLLSLIGVDVT